MARPRPVAVAVVAGVALVAALGVAVVTRDGDGAGGRDRRPGAGSPTTSAGGPDGVGVVAPLVGESRPRGGTARVGVLLEPQPDAPTLGGAAVRQLVRPHLFFAAPDGTWRPSLVVRGSDRDLGGTAARFRLRPGAMWSDGSPITADDLRRTIDARFVSAVEGPDDRGLVTVRFTQRLEDWRRLWSAPEGIAPPAPGVFGGPFVVANVTPGLDTVLARNDKWYGAPAPFLDEVRLVLVNDVVTARQLLERGELDAFLPPAYTARAEQFGGLRGVEVARARAVPTSGGWWSGLVLHGSRLSIEARRALVAAIDRRRLVEALLPEDGEVVAGFEGAGDTTWSGVGPGDVAPLKGVTVDLVGTVEDPMSGLVQRSMQRKVHPAGGRLDLRNAEDGRVQQWLAEGTYDAAFTVFLDGPTVCFVCRWGAVDEALARAADAGDADAAKALQAKLRDEALLLPLWRHRPMLVWRGALHGVRLNPYAASAAWNAWEWWRDRPSS